jgi:hypothetical protein
VNIDYLHKPSTTDPNLWIGNGRRKIYVEVINGNLHKRNPKSIDPTFKRNLLMMKIEI